MLSRFRSGGLLINSVWVNSILYWFLPSIEKRLYRLAQSTDARVDVPAYGEFTVMASYKVSFAVNGKHDGISPQNADPRSFFSHYRYVVFVRRDYSMPDTRLEVTPRLNKMIYRLGRSIVAKRIMDDRLDHRVKAAAYLDTVAKDA